MSIFILVLYSVALALVMATAVLYAVWQKGLPETYRDVIYFLSGSRNRYYGAFLVIGSLDAVYSIVIYNSEMMSEELLPEHAFLPESADRGNRQLAEESHADAVCSLSYYLRFYHDKRSGICLADVGGAPVERGFAPGRKHAVYPPSAF